MKKSIALPAPHQPPVLINESWVLNSPGAELISVNGAAGILMRFQIQNCTFPSTCKDIVGVFVPIPSRQFILSQKRFEDCVSPFCDEPNTICPLVNPVSIHQVSVPIPTVLPIRESQLLNVRIFSLLLKVFQSVAVSTPVVVIFALTIPNTPVRLLYVSGPVTQRADRARASVKYRLDHSVILEVVAENPRIPVVAL